MTDRDISMWYDNMGRLTETILLSVVRQYMPFIFGPHAEVFQEMALPGGMRPDFVVSLAENDYAIVEVRNQSPNTQFRLDAVADQLLAYSEAFRSSHPAASVSLVLIMVGALSDEHRDYLAHRGIDRIIETAELLSLIKANPAPSADVVHVLDSDAAHGTDAEEAPRDEVPRSTAEVLLANLDGTPPGKPAWSQYQKLVGNILEFLFCPPLTKPHSELPNNTGTNRRDFVFPNYAPDGFWASLKSHYAAHLIVVDAKNFTKKVGKTEVLQISNYLSEHGAGLFGLIVSRNQCAYSAEVTQREQWAIHRKMIVMLNDADVRQMFAIQLAGGDPSDLIRQKIEDFRLSF